MTEFNLSKKIVDLKGFTNGLVKSKYYWEKDVKEKVQNAQRRLKEFDEEIKKQGYTFRGTKEQKKAWDSCCQDFKRFIDKIFKEEFGEKLT